MSSKAASVEIVRSIAELRAIEPEWTRLHDESRPRNPFLGFDWTLACWVAKSRPASLFVATVRIEGRLAAVAPLCIETWAGLKILRFIGHERSDYLGFLIASPGDGEQSLLAALTRIEPEWDLVLLENLTPSYSALGAARHQGEYVWHQTRWTSAPYCVWDGDWESFHKEGPVWAREARRRSRRFFREGYRVECFTGIEASSKMPLVSQIEARSWKGKERVMRLQAGPGASLLQRAFETLGARGEMELWLAFVGDKAVAFHIYFVLEDRFWNYQTAYDEAFSQTRAGSISAYVAVESAWQRGIREFDHLSGDEPYKIARSNASRGIYHLAGHRRTLRGWLGYALLLAPRWRLRAVPALRTMYRSARSVLRARSNRSDG